MQSQPTRRPSRRRRRGPPRPLRVPRTLAKGLGQLNANLDIFCKKFATVWQEGIFDLLDDPDELTPEVHQHLRQCKELLEEMRDVIAEQLACVDRAIDQARTLGTLDPPQPTRRGP